jgi:electron transfer flavoprotein beta subunit
MSSLRIVVLVKQVPDAADERRFTDDHTTDREGVEARLSELDEHAIEQALKVVESGVDAEVTYLTMGPEQAVDALRKALSMGGDKAVHVVDDALAGSDAPATSLVLAAALERIGFDLVMCGMASTDGGMAVLPAMLAERLGVPQATLAGELTVTPDGVRIRRDGDTASEEIQAPLPAVVSVTDQTGEARYPSFKGIMAAKRKPLETLTLADLGIPPDKVGLGAAWTRVHEVTARPPRQAGTVIVDDGNGGIELVDFLAGRRFVEGAGARG